MKENAVISNSPVQQAKKSRDAFFRPVIQPKLSINEAGDIHEQEADAMADKVMRMGDTAFDQHFFKPSSSSIQRKCQHCEEEEEKKLHRKESGTGTTEVPAESEGYIHALNGGGRPLTTSEKGFFEPKFGNDFSNVRLHTDTAAAESAKSINALAYTHGNNIVFGPGQYQPGTDGGKKLMAHELTHTVQQTGAIQRKPDCSYEKAQNEVTGVGKEVKHLKARPDKNADNLPGDAVTDGDAVVIKNINGAEGYTNVVNCTWAWVDIPGKKSPDKSYPVLHGFIEVKNLKAKAVKAPVPAPVAASAAPAASGAGADFDQYMLNFTALEDAAIKDGVSFNDRITAFRKIYYTSTGSSSWDILIPGAANIGLPASWGNMQAQVQYINEHQVININNSQVDIGHLLTGLDAGNHPASISYYVIKMKSNKEATTFTGDLGSVVVEYYHGSTTSFRDTAMDLQPQLLNDKYNVFASVPDMAGDADAYSLTPDSSITLANNLMNYYAKTKTVKKRYTRFAAAINLGTLAGNTFSNYNEAWKTAMQDEVFETALAYAGSKGHKGDVILIMKDPGPGIMSPTFWEAYWNITGWVIDKFVSDLAANVAAESKP